MLVQLKHFRATLADHIQQNVWQVAAQNERLQQMFSPDFWLTFQDPDYHLTIGDLRSLESATAMLQIRGQWLTDVRAYDCYLECIAEVKHYLGSTAQEEWWSSAKQFLAELSDPRLSISDGLEILRCWMEDIDRLVRGINSYSAFEMNSSSQNRPAADSALLPELSRIADQRGPDLPELVGTRYVADCLGLSTQRITQMMVSNTLPPRLVVRGGDGAPYKFNRAQIDEWISTQKMPATS